MTRPRLTTALVLTALLLAGPVGAAVAGEGSPDPSPSTTSPSPAPTEPDPADEPSEEPSTTAANQAPTTVPDAVEVEPGASVNVDVLANDHDPDGDDELLRIVGTSGGHGRMSSDDDTDTVTFHARGGDGGRTYDVTYVVTDGEDESDGQLTVTVARAGVPERSVSIYLKSRPVALRKYHVHGRVRPNGGAAVVKVQRRTSKGWVRLAKDRPNAEGRYTVPFKTARPHRVKLRAVATWPSGKQRKSDVVSRKPRVLADANVSGPLRRGQVPHSWRKGCPVPPGKLRMIHINRWGYSHKVARGAIVVRAAEVGAVKKVLKGALGKRFPIRKIKPADAFYKGGRRTPTGSDKAAMRAGNTSAFNCRPVTGNPYRVSQHSYGNAVDINTIENPYVTGSRVFPSTSRRYLDRSPYRRGMILGGGVIAKRMRHLGWLWGARWSHPDYQHFSSNGG